MLLSDCFQLGVITKTHGTKGDLQIWIDSDDPEHYRKLESVLLLQNNELVPFFLERWQISASKAIAHFEGIDSIEQAAKLIKTEVFLPESFLPELDEGQFFFHDLVGMVAFDHGSELGPVTNVYNLPGHDVLAIDLKGKEALVPLSDEIVKKVDTKKKQVHLDLPEGLLDIYLDS